MRIEPIDPGELAPDAAELYRTIAGPRGGIVDGPFRAWLRSNPEFASRMNAVGGALRNSGKLDLRLAEVAVLCAARFWDARYQWAAHVPIALEAGLSQELIDDIGRGVRPGSAAADELIVRDVAVSLLAERCIPDDLYGEALALLGFDGMVELVTTIGQYSLAAIVTNGFEITLASGGPDLPERE